MRDTVLILLLGVFGGFLGAASAQEKAKRNLTIIEVPRPNSGQHTTEEATKLLPKTMATCRAVDSKNALVAGWKDQPQAFRVHVTAKNEVEVVDRRGFKKSGMDGLKAALELSESTQLSNPISVLLTAETDGWRSDVQQAILKTLFKPSIQLHIVTESDGVARPKD
jgi:hypothetical protein